MPSEPGRGKDIIPTKTANDVRPGGPSGYATMRMEILLHVYAMEELA